MILVGIAAFFTDLAQGKGGISQILAGGFDAGGSDRVADADFLCLLEEGA